MSPFVFRGIKKVIRVWKEVRTGKHILFFNETFCLVLMRDFINFTSFNTSSIFIFYWNKQAVPVTSIGISHNPIHTIVISSVCALTGRFLLNRPPICPLSDLRPWSHYTHICATRVIIPWQAFYLCNDSYIRRVVHQFISTSVLHNKLAYEGNTDENIYSVDLDFKPNSE